MGSANVGKGGSCNECCDAPGAPLRNAATCSTKARRTLPGARQLACRRTNGRKLGVRKLRQNGGWLQRIAVDGLPMVALRLAGLLRGIERCHRPVISLAVPCCHPLLAEYACRDNKSMITCEDPFVVLGVAREASRDEIRSAYRRLAMRWHPDRNPSPAAAAEFKRVHAAYELLLDDERLATWRRAGQGGMTDGAAAGDDLVQSLTLTLEQAAAGCQRTVELPHRVRCSSCAGSGRVRHNHSVPCPACSGCGRVVRAGGKTGRCDTCAGRGYLRETACSDCAGSGWRDEARTLEVTVPPALLAGERLRLARQAPLPPGDELKIAGDLYLEISLATHQLFVLDGLDLHCRIPVSIFRLLCGGRIEVPTLNGTTWIELPPWSPTADGHRLAGLGFPGKGKRAAGDLVLHPEAIHPRLAAREDCQLLELLDWRLAADLERRAPLLADWQLQLRARRDGPIA
ncbi:MAG: Heat shock protein J [Candidatus Accumulibacter sp. BA-94]|nr:MAG: Heat shock protein J [Candidatus Accumulibacter sp. BA-94]